MRHFVEQGHFVHGFMPITHRNAGPDVQLMSVSYACQHVFDLVQALGSIGLVTVTPARNIQLADKSRRCIANYDDLHTVRKVRVFVTRSGRSLGSRKRRCDRVE
jgi:hypothetical protein